MELSRVTYHQDALLIEGAKDAADLHVLAAVLFQVAHVLPVAGKGDECEMAGALRGLRAACIHKACSVFQYNDVVDMRGHADILAGHGSCLSRRNTRGRAESGGGKQEQERGKRERAKTTAGTQLS